MIDKTISNLKKLKSIHNGSYGADINTAIDIMRKYQRIKQIVKFGDVNEIGFEYIGEKISEVVNE